MIPAILRLPRPRWHFKAHSSARRDRPFFVLAATLLSCASFHRTDSPVPRQEVLALQTAAFADLISVNDGLPAQYDDPYARRYCLFVRSELDLEPGYASSSVVGKFKSHPNVHGGAWCAVHQARRIIVGPVRWQSSTTADVITVVTGSRRGQAACVQPFARTDQGWKPIGACKSGGVYD